MRTDIEILENAELYIGVKCINGVEEAYMNPCLARAIKAGAAALREEGLRVKECPIGGPSCASYVRNCIGREDGTV